MGTSPITHQSHETLRPGPIAPRRIFTVALAVLAAMSIGYLLISHRGDSTRAPEFTGVAVLPLDNLTQDSVQDYLALGLSADLRRRLDLIETLQVSPRSEIWSRRDGDRSLPTVAEDLGAEILVHGEIRLREGRLQVEVRISDGATGTTLQSVAVKASSERLFDLQRKLARSVIEALDMPLSMGADLRLESDPSRSFKAYEYYLRAQFYLEDLRNPRGPDFAADLYRRAIQLDPGFALAHAELSEALWRISIRDASREVLTDAERAAVRALELDPGLTAAQVAWARLDFGNAAEILRDHPKPDQAERELAMGFVRVGDLEKAERALRASVRTRSGNWRNWYLLGDFLHRSGRLQEAGQAYQEATTRAPRRVSWPRQRLLRIRISQGDADGAIEIFETMEEEIIDAELLASLGAAYALLDRLGEAEASFRRAAELDSQNPRYLRSLGDVLRRSGREQEATAEYTRAISLAETALAEDPENPELQCLAVLLAAKAGLCSGALPQAYTLRRHLPETVNTNHDLAVIFSICRDREMTLESLQTALNLGLSPELLSSDEEFQWLAQDVDFVQLLEVAEAVPPSP